LNDDAETIAIVFSMGGLGIILAYILGELNSKGILIDEMITGSISITDVQTFLILVFIICGLIMVAIKRR
jgi:hypothetical protein